MGRAPHEEGRSIRIINIDNIRWHNVGASYAVSMSRGLRDLGHEVLFMGKDELPPVIEAGKAGLQVDNSLLFSPWYFFSDVRKFLGIARNFRPEAVIAHRPEGMNIALVARLVPGAGDFLVVRARVDIRPVRKNVFNRWLYRRLDGVIAPMGESRDRHLALGMEAVRVATLPGGVDTERFRPEVDGAAVRAEFSIPAGAPLAGIVARLDPVKGHRYFIEAAKIVLARVPGAYFAIIGEEANIKRSDLRSLAGKAGVSERIRFIGRRPDIERCVAALDVGVVASTGSEALSRAALEYMAAGVAVVATYVGGLPYIIEPGVNGILAPPGDPAHLAQAIVQLFQNSEMRERMAAEGLARARREYSIPALARLTVEFLESLRAMRRKA